MNQAYEFRYSRNPAVPLLVVGSETGISAQVTAFIDTGADVTAFDASIAEQIGLVWQEMPALGFRGVSGGRREARVGEVELLLLYQPELSTTIDVLFVEDLNPTVGNLIGLDVLSRFDLFLSHSLRFGYINRVSDQVR